MRPQSVLGGVAPVVMIVLGGGCQFIGGLTGDVVPLDGGSTSSTSSTHTPTCGDGVKNGNETGKDCGGSCLACAVGEGCGTAADCVSKSCSGGVCLAPTCGDKVRNGDETDVDCGGGKCAACPVGKGCIVGTDCESTACSAGICIPSACVDKVKDGDETDVDCGGKTCPQCGFGAACSDDPDCVTGFCTGGVCDAAIVATGLTSPTSLAVDTNYAYWTDATGGVVMKADLGTGSASQVAAGQSAAQGLVVDSTSVYWVTCKNPGAIVKAPIFGGGMPSQLVGNLVNPCSLAIDGGNLYYASRGGGGTQPTGSIVELPAAGGTSTPVVTSVAPDAIAVLNGVLCYAAGGSVITQQVGSSSHTTLANAQVGLTGLAVDTVFAYWASGGGPGTVLKAPLTGGSSTIVAPVNVPGAVAADGPYVYWVDAGTVDISTGEPNPDGAVLKAPITGGSPVILASGQTSPSHLVVFGLFAYWTTSGDAGAGAVKKVHK